MHCLMLSTLRWGINTTLHFRAWLGERMFRISSLDRVAKTTINSYGGTSDVARP